VTGPIPHLSARPAALGDAEAVAAVVRECNELDIGEVFLDEGDIVSDWQRPSVDLERDSVLVFAGEDVVAYGDVHDARAEVYVRPKARGRGLGSALMRWTWAVAADHGSGRVGQTVAQRQTDVAALFAQHGYEPLWTSWVLELPPGADIARGVEPPDVVIRAAVAGEERAAYEVIESAFGEWPNREPTAFDDWAATTVRRPGYEPWQLLVAVAGAGHGAEERVVGACFVMLAEDVGWVHQIAVDRSYRHRGIARSLLLHAFAATRARGGQGCELSTDSRTGALTLYERVGMRVKHSFVHWAKELEP
jgi:GNAT superfamily N-acetyltransferase